MLLSKLVDFVELPQHCLLIVLVSALAMQLLTTFFQPSTAADLS